MTNKVLSTQLKQEDKNKEIIIKLLLEKYSESNSNEIHFSRKDCENLNISEPNVSRVIHRLQQDELLHIEIKSIHNDFSRFWILKLESKCINYFKNKKHNIIDNRRKSLSEFRAWITLIIAILAFFLSILSLYLQFFQKEIPSKSYYQESSQTDMIETRQNSDIDVYETMTNV